MESPRNPFQHVDLRVADLAAALPFYEAFLPALGFHRVESSGRWHCFDGAGSPPQRPWFAFIEDPEHQPNANRIAFWAASPAEVDRLAALAERAGAVEMSGPKAMPEYGGGYYAAFFEDPCGNRLEICFVEE